MSNETKRDVFDELLEIAGNAMDQAMSAQYPSDENGCAPSGIGKAIRDILDPIEKRYDAALPDETDNQKSCPYCHSKSGHKISQDAYSFWYRNKRFKPLFCSNCGRKL